MSRTQCVLALLALCLELAHSFSWDFVMAKQGRLDFYEDYKIKFTEHNTPPEFLEWVAYDPVHKRVLTTTNYNWHYFVTGYDVETEITHFSMRLSPEFFVKDYPLNDIRSFAYDPITELIFASDENSLYSFELKPGEENKVNGTVLIDLEEDEIKFREAAVDSCGKYVYWIANNYKIERVRYDGTDRKVIIETNKNILRKRLNIERQKMYWIEYPVNNEHLYTIESADLNGNNRITLYTETSEKYVAPLSLAVSKDFIYWANNERYFWKLPKNLTRVTNETGIVRRIGATFQFMAAYYDIEELNQTIQECEALKSNIESVNVSTDTSLLCVHGTKISGKNLCECAQGYTGERCDVSVCQNYCVGGDCEVSAEGQPKCRCNAGYSGDRCETNACFNYCLNNGACSINETSEPVCQCTEGYKGARCNVPVLLIKCVQTASLLKDIIKADVASVTLGREVESTCASTVV